MLTASTAPWSVDDMERRCLETALATYPRDYTEAQIRAHDPIFQWLDESPIREVWSDLPPWWRQTGHTVHERAPYWVAQACDAHGVTWTELDSTWTSTSAPSPFGEHYRSPADLIFDLTLLDPVRWAECHLVNEETRAALRLFPQQKLWLRYRPPGKKAVVVFFQCGSEVGKSFSLAVLFTYLLLYGRGDLILAGAESSHADQLWDYVVAFLQSNAVLEGQIERFYRSGYPRIVAKNGNILHFRWPGPQGAGFRSLHVSQAIALDEASELTSRKAWADFANRGLPGCHIFFSSVPNGIADRPYYEQSEAAVDVDPMNPHIITADQGAARFIWSRDLLPYRWSNPKERAKRARLCGGEDSNQFLRQWLGINGHPTESVFPWNQLVRVLRPVPGFQALHLRVDLPAGLIHWHTYQLAPGYNAESGAEKDPRGRKGTALHPTQPLKEGILELADYLPESEDDPDNKADTERRASLWLDFLKEHFQATGRADQVGIGMDLGEHSDPSEILVGRIEGQRVVDWCRRVHLKWVPYRMQADIAFAMWAHFQPRCAGADATGGPAFLSFIEGTRRVGGKKIRCHFGEYVMNAARKLPGRKGEERKTTEKRWGVQLLETAIQNGTLALPYDPMVLAELPQFRRETMQSGHVRFTSTNDHGVAAGICLALAAFDNRPVKRRPIRRNPDAARQSPWVDSHV